jgi:peptide/nickel transport system substrate-binding protein
MIRRRTAIHAGVLALTLAGGVTLAQAQQRVLRHDESAPGRIDPTRAFDYASSVLAVNLYDTLVNPKPGGGVAPSLAQSWTMSEDGRTYTFKLRPGVKFHSGGELTAEDVAFTLQRALALNAGFSRLFKGVTAATPDPLTVVFTLPEPNAPFLASLVRLPVLQKALVEKNQAQSGPYGEHGDYGDAFLAEHDAGSGAYRVTAHNPQDETVLVRFPDYFVPFAANAPDTVRIRYGVESATIRTLMMRKEWDVTSQWIPNEIKRALAETKGMSLLSESGGGVFVMPLNTRRPPTDDEHVRRAIALAIDYPALIGMMKITASFEGALPIHGTLPSGLAGSDPSIKPLSRDVAAAKAELAKSKYGANPPPFDLAWVSDVPLEEKIGLLVQQNLQEAGFTVNLVKMPWTLLTQLATKPDTTPHMTQRFAAASYPDPDALIGQEASTYLGTTLKLDWLADSTLDGILDKARTAADDQQRRTLYGQAQQRLLETMPTIFAFETVASFARQDYVAAPTLQDPKQGVAMQGGNWMFRTFSLNK